MSPRTSTSRTVARFAVLCGSETEVLLTLKLDVLRLTSQVQILKVIGPKVWFKPLAPEGVAQDFDLPPMGGGGVPQVGFTM